MKFGTFEIDVIETGHFALDGGAMFGVVPKNLWNRAIDADDQNRIPMTMRSLIIRFADRVIIVDTGIGNKNSEKFNSIYAVDLHVYTLEKSLAGLGIAPHDVTDVIQTHLHFDHAGGSTIRAVDGTLNLVFPNAVHYVQRDHWEWANNPTLKDQASFVKDDFLPLKEYGKLELIDGPEELFPGIRLRVVNGHTTGQQLVELTDADRSILYTGDLVPMSHHVPAAYIMGYDIRPLVSLEEKLRILTDAADTSTVLVFEHDRYVEAATITADGTRITVKNKGSLEEMVMGLE